VWEAKVDRGIFVIGNESGGIRGEVLKHAKHLISIPSSEGGAESLNAAVAAGVVLAILRKA
jgi:tRNA G18 (ribose-2'-O)-methylase SpoU